MRDSEESNSKEILHVEMNGGKVEEVEFSEAFELTGHGRFNHVVLLMSGLVLLNVTMESVGMGYVITSSECDLHLSHQQKGWVSAAAFIGIMSTSFLWGSLSDRFGRRAIILPTTLISAALSIASSFSVNVWMLFVLRLLTGCFTSGSSATVYAYLGETHITSRRGTAIAWGSAFISLAFIFLPGLAWLIIPGSWELQFLSQTVHPWQVLMWFWCIPGILAAAILFFLPESPKFLLAKNRLESAVGVLSAMYSWNTGKRREDYPVKRLAPGEQPSGSMSAVKSIGVMFQPPLLRCVLISHLCMFAVFMLSSGFYMWVPDILNSILDNKSEESLSICDIIHSKLAPKNSTETKCHSEVSMGVFPISMGMGAVFAITYLAIGVIIDKVGKCRLFIIIMVICGLATAASGLVPQGGLATALLVLALCSGCSGSILAAIAVDVFPTSMRALAICIMYMTGRAGAAVGASILGSTLQTHCQQAFVGFGLVVTGSAMLLFLWPNPERVRKEIENKGLTY